MHPSKVASLALRQCVQLVQRVQLVRPIVHMASSCQHARQALDGGRHIDAHATQQLVARRHRVHGDDSALAHQPRMVGGQRPIVRRLAAAVRLVAGLQFTKGAQELANEVCPFETNRNEHTPSRDQRPSHSPSPRCNRNSVRLADT